MKILIDTNIVLDLFLDRKPFSHAAGIIFSATEKGYFISYLGATTVTTIHYLLSKALGAKDGKIVIEKVLRLFEIAPITRTVLTSALLLRFADYEDAVLHEAARHSGIQNIVTRDRKGFQNSSISIYTPDEFILGFSK